MAVFACVADESADENNFFYGGFAAPLDDWEGCFADAWNERVISGPPRIPFLHMTEIRDWKWQEEHGLKPWDADQRLDAAAEIIRSTGSLVPVIYSADKQAYTSILREHFAIAPRKKRARLEPDYLLFLWFAFTALTWLDAEYGDRVETVDFWVERNTWVTRNIAIFHKALKDSMEYVGSSHLIPLIGGFLEVGKECIPVQAADMLSWHARNAKRAKLDRFGEHRYWKMVEGGNRFGCRGEMSAADMHQLAEAFAKKSSAWKSEP